MRRLRYPKTVETEILRYLGTQIRKNRRVSTPFNRFYGFSVYKHGICVCSVECARNSVTVLDLSNHSWEPKIISYPLSDPNCFTDAVAYVELCLKAADTCKKAETRFIRCAVGLAASIAFGGIAALILRYL